MIPFSPNLDQVTRCYQMLIFWWSETIWRIFFWLVIIRLDPGYFRFESKLHRTKDSSAQIFSSVQRGSFRELYKIQEVSTTSSWALRTTFDREYGHYLAFDINLYSRHLRNVWHTLKAWTLDKLPWHSKFYHLSTRLANEGHFIPTQRQKLTRTASIW